MPPQAMEEKLQQAKVDAEMHATRAAGTESELRSTGLAKIELLTWK